MISFKQRVPGGTEECYICGDTHDLLDMVLQTYSGFVNRMVLCRPCLRELSARGTVASKLLQAEQPYHMDENLLKEAVNV